MTKFEKHKESIDVQIRMRVFDKEGHEMPGIIEYDPSTGWGKQIIDAEKGLVRDWYCQGGHVQLDGEVFDAERHDDDRASAIKELINAKIHKEKDPSVYQDMLTNYINRHRANSKALRAATEINTGDTVTINEQGFVSGAGQNVSNP